MGNIKNYEFRRIDLRLSHSDYWDFFLANDKGSPNTDIITSGDCFVVWYDFNNPNIYENSNTDTIYSLVHWTGATNTGYTFDTIGLTGIDNGLITFEKDPSDLTNQTLVNALTGSTLFITSGDTRMVMNRVTGTTGDFIYPIDLVSDVSGSYAQLCGGFYQGYYKIDGYDYEVLPTRVNQSWSAEFWLKPSGVCSGYTATTLNDEYPNNKGFFFYMGTRAENKFWDIWYGADTGCTSACTTTYCTSGETVSEWCTIPKENEVSIIGDYNVLIPLDPPQVEIDLVTNPFLIYGRACDTGYQVFGREGVSFLTDENGDFVISEDGFNIALSDYDPYVYSDTPNPNSGSTSCSCSRGCSACKRNHDGLGTKNVYTYSGGGIVVVTTAKEKVNFQNPFLIYGRGGNGSCLYYRCTGPNDGLAKDTVCSFSGFTEPIDQIDYNLDIIDNAIGFRIKDDGSIGYRLLTVTGSCVTNSDGTRTYVSGATIEENYSLSGMVKPNEWSYVVVKFVTDYKDDCDLKISKPRKGKLLFYVNAKLKHVVNDFDEFIARRLNEYKDKQIGVPFNFSLGGGSQGLIESQTFGGLDLNDRGLPIQENFAGTFIGGISQFKFNICDLNYYNIVENYNNDSGKYNPQPINPSVLTDEDGNIIISEQGNPILIP